MMCTSEVCGSTFYTDHAALVYMVKAQTATNNGRLMQYLMDIQHYDFQLVYKKGQLHLDADAVSRLLKCGADVLERWKRVQSPRSRLSSPETLPKGP
jgi:hypothetical protein